MTTGTVLFSNPSKGASYIGSLDEQGRFRFEVARGHGLPPGEYKVAISPYTPPKPSLDFVAPSRSPKAYPNVPQRYQNEATSGLSATVKSGDNENFRFDLP